MRNTKKCYVLLFLFLMFTLSFTAKAAQSNTKPVRQEQLTGEQKKDGWELIDGYGYPPDDLQGQSGKTSAKTGSNTDGKPLSNVKFDANIPPGQTEPFILYFANADTYQEYYVELYASENYQSTVKMPPGAYYFTGGGPENDYMSLYKIVSPESFVVRQGTDLIVQPVIRDKGSILDKEDTSDTFWEEETHETAQLAPPQQEESKNMWKIYILSAFFFCVIGTIIIVIGIAKFRDDNDI